MAQKNHSSGRITLKMVMNHMQAGFSTMNARFAAIDARFMSIDARFDRLEKKVDKGFADFRDHMRWMESHDFPKRVSRLEDKVFAGMDV